MCQIKAHAYKNEINVLDMLFNVGGGMHTQSVLVKPAERYAD